MHLKNRLRVLFKTHILDVIGNQKKNKQLRKYFTDLQNCNLHLVIFPVNRRA